MEKSLKPGSLEYASALQEALQKAIRSLEEEWGGDVWRYCSVLSECHSVDATGDFACSCYSVGYEENIINGVVKWMNEIAGYTSETDEDKIDQMKRMLLSLHSVVSSEKWSFRMDEIDPNSVRFYTDKKS